MTKQEKTAPVDVGVSVEKETARAEFERFAAAWDIDTDLADMEEDDRSGFNKWKRTIVRVMMSGHLVVGDTGDPSYTLRWPTVKTGQLDFRVPGGKALLDFDRFKDTHNIHKIMSYMGNFTGQPDAIFGQMDGRDLKVCQALAVIFLASA